MWGKWGEEEVTNDWSEVGKERGDSEEDDIRSHVKVWAHGRKQRWEPQLSSLVVFDPAPIPDYDFKMEIGRELGCYWFSGVVFAGDKSDHKGRMGAGAYCLGNPDVHQCVGVG